ncbi:MAG: translation elongation factor Ts [Defluviitaleaceae bacterium]|nr:translation elongation factor Ts [Defluviitaleaceae bacterium]
MAVTAAMVKELRELSGAGMSACKNALVEANGEMARAVEILREKGLAAAAKKAGRVAAEGLVMTALTADRKNGAIVEVNSETDFVAKNDDFITFVKDVAAQTLASKAQTVEELLEEKWAPDPSIKVSEAFSQKVATIGENISMRRFTRFNVGADSVLVDYIHGGGRIGAMIKIVADNITDAVVEAGRNVCMQIAAMSPQFLDRTSVPAEYLDKEREILTQQTIAEGKPANIAEKMVEGRLNKMLKEICLVDQEYVKDGEMTVGQYLESIAKAVGGKVAIAEYVRYEKGEGIEKKEENFAEEVSKAMQG